MGKNKQATNINSAKLFLKDINFNIFNNLGLNQRQIPESKIKDFLLFKHARYSQKRGLIDSGLSYTGVLKLIKVNEYVDPDALLTILDSTGYDLPIKVVFSTKKVRKSSPRFQLTKSRLKLKRNTSLDDEFQGAVSEKKMQSSQKLIDQIELDETNLFDFELHIILEKTNEAEVVDCAKKLITDLSHIGDFGLETLRPLKALKSCLPSENHHSPLTFNTESLFCLTPLYTRGDGNTQALEVPKTSILFHRKNMTESYFDMFSALSYSTAIVGATGTGKSFLMNLIISCLCKDDMRSIFHIDVGSSGYRNAKAIGSKIFNISLNEVTGMNPFRILDHSGFDLSVVEVLSSFLKVLLKEDSETHITKEVSAGIEFAILKFCGSFKDNKFDASLKGFVDFCNEKDVSLPRLKILDRWVNGLYRRAINDQDNRLEFSRTNYFNFSDIDQANNSEFVEAVTMACFSLVSLQKKVNPKFKQTIVCDEFKFQKARSLDNFITIATNYRKVDGALIIGAQSVDQISTEENSQILESMAHTFIFNRGNTKWKNDILNLTDGDILKLKEIEKINGFDASSHTVKKTKSLFREVLYKNAASDGLVYRIIPSKSEYWKLTSKGSEVEKLARIQELTGATLDEVVGVVGALL